VSPSFGLPRYVSPSKIGATGSRLRRFLEVAREPAGYDHVCVFLLFTLLDVQADLDAGQQHRLRAKQARQLGHGDVRRVEVLGVGPDAKLGPRVARPYRPDDLQLLDDVAVGEHDAMHLAFALHLDFHALGQRIRDGDADAVQAAGERIGAAPVLLVELAAGVQARIHDLEGRDFLFGCGPTGIPRPSSSTVIE
jgi:hypothetical protein